MLPGNISFHRSGEYVLDHFIDLRQWHPQSSDANAPGMVQRDFHKAIHKHLPSGKQKASAQIRHHLGIQLYLSWLELHWMVCLRHVSSVLASLFVMVR